MAGALRAEVRTGARVSAVSRDRAGYRVELERDEPVTADAVVLHYHGGRTEAPTLCERPSSVGPLPVERR